ncbi:MAG TPA: RICIN domain-containing protein [Candidatus Egerieicola pullicola]|uniref:RICIN domain-containing protein n=1 Tax=Candidatus Egerieicola pullicola TaxID=2840775 RepID=A0A9D1AIA3_9FIRM|nr:RICIN domain-containing protein [Candidatus Egerieicola pullicola]
MANAIYQIKTANGALALEVVNTTLQLGSVTGADNQKWEMTGEKDGQVSFINVESKTAIDVAMMGTENGTPVHVWQVLDDAMTQKWMIKGEKIVSAFAADKVLDAGMFPSEGSTLQLWDDVDGDSQKWVLVDMTPAPKKAPAKKAPAKKAPAKKAETTKAAAAKKEEAPKAAAVKKEEAPKAAAAKKEEAPKAAVAKKEEAPKAAAAKKEEAPKAAAVKKEAAPKAAAKKTTKTTK